MEDKNSKDGLEIHFTKALDRLFRPQPELTEVFTTVPWRPAIRPGELEWAFHPCDHETFVFDGNAPFHFTWKWEEEKIGRYSLRITHEELMPDYYEMDDQFPQDYFRD